MKNYKLIAGIGIVSILFISVLGISTTKAQSEAVGFLDNLASKLANLIFQEIKADLRSPNELLEPTAGAEGDTFSSSKRAGKVFSPDATNTMVSTTPYGALYNSSGVDRVLKKCDVYIEGNSETGVNDSIDLYGTHVMYLATSTTATASSTTPTIHNWTFSSSSIGIAKYSASTTLDVWEDNEKLIWGAGEYLILDGNKRVSTTEGYFACSYDLFN